MANLIPYVSFADKWKTHFLNMVTNDQSKHSREKSSRQRR